MGTRKLSLAKVFLSLAGFILLWTIVTDAWNYSEIIFHAGKGSLGKYVYDLMSRFIWAIPAIILIHFYAKDLPTKWNELFSNKPHIKPFIIVLAINTTYIIGSMIYIHGGIWINPNVNFIKDISKFVMVGFVEELVFRGWGLNALSAFMTERRANIVSTVFFVLLHLPAYFIKFYLNGTFPVAAIATQCIMVLVLGLIFGYLYNKGKSLWSPMILHFLSDFLSIMLIG